MKKILVTQRVIENRDYHETRDALDIRWGQFLHQSELLPILVPSSYPLDQYLNEVEWDGLLLTGGNDPHSMNSNPLSKQRDKMESQLLSKALHSDKPIIGVCRGLQMIAQHFTLSLGRCQNHVATRHSLEVDQTSKYALYLTQVSDVNSYHQICAIEKPSPLKISAKGPDGCIEALEHPSHRLFACMWHPEREAPLHGRDTQFFNQFYHGVI